MTLARVTTVAVLAGRGWWFVQEKVLLGLPMLGAVGLAAVLIAGPRLLSAWRAPEAGTPDRQAASGVVLLLTAGYAALAGLVVTLVAGYPLTWSTALIATAVVGAGALLTARVVAAPADTTGDADIAPTGTTDARVSRADGSSCLAGGAVVAGTGATGVGLLFVPAESVATGGGPGPSSRSGRGPCRWPTCGGPAHRHPAARGGSTHSPRRPPPSGFRPDVRSRHGPTTVRYPVRRSPPPRAI